MKTNTSITIDQLKLYLPCQVYRKDINTCIPFTGFTDMGMDAGLLTDDAGQMNEKLLLVSGFASRWSIKSFIEKGCRLLLRSLFSMTQKESIEIAKLAISYKDSMDADYEILEIRKSSFILRHKSGKYQIFPQKAFTITLERYAEGRIIPTEDITAIHNPHLIFQYLLSRKFDIGILPKEAYVIIDEKNGGFTEPK